MTSLGWVSPEGGNWGCHPYFSWKKLATFFSFPSADNDRSCVATLPVILATDNVVWLHDISIRFMRFIALYKPSCSWFSASELLVAIAKYPVHRPTPELCRWTQPITLKDSHPPELILGSVTGYRLTKDAIATITYTIHNTMSRSARRVGANDVEITYTLTLYYYGYCLQLYRVTVYARKLMNDNMNTANTACWHLANIADADAVVGLIVALLSNGGVSEIVVTKVLVATCEGVEGEVGTVGTTVPFAVTGGHLPATACGSATTKQQHCTL